MDVSELSVRITAQNSASDVLHQVQRDLDDTHKAAIAAGVGLTALGASMAAGLLAAGTAAASFEKAMSQVTAVLDPAEIKASGSALAELALSLGKSGLGFSAQEAATGLEAMAKAGISVQDQMAGASSVLALAAAGGIKVGEAADFAANTLSVFSLKGTDMAHVADLMAGAANATTADVGDLRLAMQQFGAVANLTSQTVDSTTTAIALMAQAGIKGSDAGTSLKTMFLNLQPTTDKQRAEFERLGLSIGGVNGFIDQQTGAFKQAGEIAALLNAKLGGLTAAQKAASLEIIFGSDAIRAGTVLTNAGAEGWAKLTGEIAKVSALEVAHERLNNLNGSVTNLQNSVGVLAIQFGGSLAPALRPVTDGLTGVVNQLSTMPPAAMQTAAAVATIATGATLLSGSILLATGAAAAMGTTLGALAIAAAPVVIPIAAIGVALGGLAAAWINDWGGIQTKSTDANGAIQADLKATGAGLATLGGQAHDATAALGELLGRFAEWDARAQQKVAPTSLGPLQTSQGANLAQLFPDRSQAVGILAQAEDLGREYAHSLADSLENGLQDQRMGERLAGWASQQMNALGVPLSAALVTATEDAVTASVDNPVIHAQFTDWGAKIASEVGASLQANKGSVQAAIADLMRVEPNAGLQDLGVQQILERGNALKATQQILATLTPAEQAHYQVLLLSAGADNAANEATGVLNAMRAAGIITLEQYNQALAHGTTTLQTHAATATTTAAAVQTLDQVMAQLAKATTPEAVQQALLWQNANTAIAEAMKSLDLETAAQVQAMRNAGDVYGAANVALTALGATGDEVTSTIHGLASAHDVLAEAAYRATAALRAEQSAGQSVAGISAGGAFAGPTNFGAIAPSPMGAQYGQTAPSIGVNGPNYYTDPVIGPYLRNHPGTEQQIMTNIMGPNYEGTLGVGPAQREAYQRQLEQLAEAEHQTQIAAENEALERQKAATTTHAATAATVVSNAATFQMSEAMKQASLQVYQMTVGTGAAARSISSMPGNIESWAMSIDDLTKAQQDYWGALKDAANALRTNTTVIAGQVIGQGQTYGQIYGMTGTHGGSTTAGSSTGIVNITPGSYFGLPVVSGSPITGGSLRGYADGGMVPEPSYLVSQRTGRAYATAAERGPEPIGYGLGGGPVINLTINASGVDALRDTMFWERAFDQQITPILRKRGLVRR